jgi:hypothetical protein
MRQMRARLVSHLGWIVLLAVNSDEFHAGFL